MVQWTRASRPIPGVPSFRFAPASFWWLLFDAVGRRFPCSEPRRLAACAPLQGGKLALGMRFILFLNQRGCHKRTRCDECLNCLNPKLLKRFGCLSGKDNAATPAKKREVDLLQWGLDPAAEHRSPAEREDLVEPQSIRGGGAAGVRKHANPVAKPALDPKHSAQVAQLQKSSAS